MLSVTLPSSALIDLHALRLDDARALLGHSGTTTLPEPEAAPEAYLQSVIDGLCELSLRDPLTGLANRRHFRSVLAREIEIVARSGNSALLLMLDIDHFKKINDTHGHLSGDKVLQAVARCVASCVRPQDTVARYGGEEFAVVLPDCQVSFGEAVAERIRQSLAGLSIPVTPLLNLEITMSIGGAFAPVWVRSTADLWTERADTQLYRAKAEGRNRVCIDHQQVMSVSAEEKSLLFGPLNMGEPAWIENVAIESPDSAMQRVNS
jgi:two-component system, cell cycle response regulator